MGTTTTDDDDDATDDGRSAVVGRSTTAGAKQKMRVSIIIIMFSCGTANYYTVHAASNLSYKI